MTKRPETLQLNDLVWWRGAWGSDEPRIAEVIGIERWNPDETVTRLDVVPWRNVNEEDIVVDLANGRWAWAYQISPLKLWNQVRLPSARGQEREWSRTADRRPAMQRNDKKHPHLSLGADPKSVRVSAEEMHLAYLNRLRTGEPIQTWIRRLIRENAAMHDVVRESPGTPEEVASERSNGPFDPRNTGKAPVR